MPATQRESRRCGDMQESIVYSLILLSDDLKVDTLSVYPYGTRSCLVTPPAGRAPQGRCIPAPELGMTRQRKRRVGGREMLENRSAKTDPQPEVAMPQLMDAQDVALILKITPKTVHKLVRRGKLGCVQVTEKDRRFTREQVQAYIDAQSTEVRIDSQKPNRVRCLPPKGGEKSLGVSRTSLLKEMSQWQ